MARNFSQEKDLNYDKKFLLVAKYVILWLVCVLLEIFSLYMYYMNVVVSIFYKSLKAKFI